MPSIDLVDTIRDRLCDLIAVSMNKSQARYMFYSGTVYLGKDKQTHSDTIVIRVKTNAKCIAHNALGDDIIWLM